jgi:hypothetical protein
MLKPAFGAGDRRHWNGSSSISGSLMANPEINWSRDKLIQI